MPSCRALSNTVGGLNRRPLLACLLMVLTAVQGLSAFTLPETSVWIGETDDKWSNPANWSTNVVPGVDDVVSFTDSSSACRIDVAEVQITALLTTANFFNKIDATGATITITNGLTLNSGSISGDPHVILLGGGQLTHTRNGEVPGSYAFGILELRSTGSVITPTFDARELSFSTLLITADTEVEMTSELVQPNANNIVRMDNLVVAGSLRYGDINLQVDSMLRLFDDGGSTAPSITVTAGSSTTGFFDFRGSTWDLQAGKIDPGEYDDWILASTGEAVFIDASGGQQPMLAPGEPVYLRVVDVDRNLDASVAETLTVTVTNPDLGAGESLEQEFVTLTETGPSTGIFTNLASGGYPTDTNTAPIASDGTLSMPVIANLEARYLDGPYETITYDYFYGNSAHFWIGGGETDSWFEAGNWFSNEIPFTDATVVFGKTDAACYNDSTVTVHHLRIEPPYSGMLTLLNNLTCSELSQASGTITSGVDPVTLQCTGDLIQTGGSFNAGATTLWLNGSNQQSVQLTGATAAGIGFASSVVLSGSSTFSGLIDLAGVLTIDGNHSCGSLLMEDFNKLFINAASSLSVTEQFTTGESSEGQVEVLLEDGGLLDLSTAGWTQTTLKLTENGGFVRYPASALTFLDANGEPVSSHSPGEPVRLSIRDLDANTDNLTVESVTVTVRDLISGDSETVTLTETGANSGQFNNAAGGLATSSSFGTAVSNDENLEISQIAGVSYLLAHYQDPQDPTDTLATPLVEGTVYWDDNSEDGLWSTAANWSTDTVPTTTDTVLFGPGAQSSCLLQEEITIAGLVMTSAYSGSLETGGLLCRANTIELHGGSVAAGSGLACTDTAFVDDTSLANATLLMESGSSALTTTGVTIATLLLSGPEFSWTALGTTVNSLTIDGSSGVLFQGAATAATVGNLGNLMITAESTLTVSTSFTQAEDGITPSTVVDGGRIVSQGGWSLFAGTLTERNGGYVQHPASNLTVTDSEGSEVESVTLGNDLLLELDDADEVDGSASPTITVTVSSSVSGDSETVSLTLDTAFPTIGHFTSTTALPTATNGTAEIGDGILQATEGETLVFVYQDDEDPSDRLEASLPTSGSEPPPVLPTVDLVADDLLLFEGQSAAVGLTLSAASDSTVNVQLRLSDPGESGLGEQDFAGDFTLAIPAGATSATFTLQSTQDETPEAIGHGLLFLASATGADLATEAQVVAIELRDDDGDGEALALTTASPLVVATLGASVTLVATDGTPPYSFSATNAVFSASPQLAGAYDLDGDGDNDLGQRLLLTPLAAGDVSVTVSDAAGATSDLALTAVAGSQSTTPPPSVPVSDGASAIYLPIAAASAEGRQRLLDLAATAADDEQRLFAWSATDQAYVELPAEPTGGLLPGQGIFLASREAITLDLSGSAAVLPFDILLAPGWNFIGIPALASASTTFDFASLELYDEGGFNLATATRLDLIGTAAFFWDGVAYQEASTLVPGNGYWIFNASADPAQTLTLRLSVSGQLTAVLAASVDSTSSGHRREPADSGPPTPPTSPTGGSSSSASPSGGCGAGIALLMLPLLLLGFARWQRSG